ncbi:MAG: hypothetical protein IKI11_07165 [Neisseriaceae bacterium]|nr:hypothetical protein [Neisseriaceae bacterium]
MELFVYIVLFLLGVFFIRNGLNSLKKLEENNQKWERLLTRKSEFYLANFLEAQELIKKLKRYISFLARFELLNGTLVILFTLLTVSGNISNSDFSTIGTFSLILLGGSFFLNVLCSNGEMFSAFTGTSFAISIPFIKRYELVIDYLSKECKDNFCNIEECFAYYIREKKLEFGSYETNYRNTIFFRNIIFSFGYSGFLLFIIAFYFDFSFRQMVVDFVSKPFT